MSIYKEYLSGEARDIAIQEATLENELMKLDTMYEMSVLQLEQMYRDAELKVLAESGTYEDLMFLYEQADAEVKPQQGNIFQKIIDAIMGILGSIGNAIKNIFSIGSPEDEVEVPKDTVETAKKSLGMFGNIKQGIERVKNKDYLGGLQILKAIALPALAVGAVAGGTVVMVKMKKGEADALVKKLGEMKDYFTDAIAKIKQAVSNFFNKNKPATTDANGNATNANEGTKNDEGILKGVFDKLRGFASNIKKIIDSFFTYIKKAFPGAKKKIDNLADQGKQVINNVKDIKNTAENMVGDAKDAVKGDQYETVKGNFGLKWKIDKTTGKIRLVDKKGKDKKIDANTKIPPNVVGISNKIKNQNAGNAGGNTTNESSLIEEFQNENYIIEMTEDSIEVSELTEIALESTSIFGYDITNEILLQESDAFDEDLSDLVDLFSDL